jgi:hypothetical protein
LALGHSRDIDEQWRVGGKFKVLFGIGQAEAKADRLRITMNDDVWAIDADTRLNASVGNTSWEYEDAHLNAPDGRRRVDGIDEVKPGMNGFGLGLDLGATYKLDDDWQFSATLTDLGFISWNNTLQASSRGTYQFDGFDEFYAGGNGEKIGTQFEQIGDDLEELFSLYDDGKGSKTTALSTTLNLGGEYTLPSYRNFTAGLLYSGRFAGLYSYHSVTLAANVRPVSWFEASLNTSVTSTGMGLGAYLGFQTKGFNVFIASDRIPGAVSKEYIPLNSTNANVAFGINFPL